MSEQAIRVAGLGKKYHLGSVRAAYSTMRDSLRMVAQSTLRGLIRKAERVERRPSFWALKDVGFEINRGEVVGIIGRNGAGKSTLLKILSRITEPTEGEIDLHGRVGSLLEVGTGFHPELTGRENIALNGAILGMRRGEIARKFDDIVAFAEIEKFIDTPVKYYSSGMYTRLAFAVAAHLEPEILIVDEVLAVGDAEFQKKCLGKMGEVAAGGRTVLFVSHNMSAVQALCRRCLLLSKGELTLNGPTESVLPVYMSQAKTVSEYVRTTPSDKSIALHSAAIDIIDEPTRQILKLRTEITSDSTSNVSIDIRLLDMSGTAIGFAAVGSFNSSQSIELRKGQTVVVSEHDISMLAQGSYQVQIDIAQPTFGYFDRIEGFLGFDCVASPQPGCYRRMQQSWGFGSVEFPYISHSVQLL